MPGLRKAWILQRIRDVLERSQVQLVRESLVGRTGDLPWQCGVEFTDGSWREYNLYFWTVGHGGKSRSVDEYRIQIKLSVDRHLRIDKGTTILLGYYHEAVDRSGRAVGSRPPDGMEVFVAWDALRHLRLGESSSCQVPFSLMYQAYLRGKAIGARSLAANEKEMILAFRPEYLSSYLRLSAGGHNRVDVSALCPAYIA